MQLSLTWPEIALRLSLTLLAGALIGMNRGEHGRPAGLRTAMLVCMAASLSMLQVNLLLGLDGKPPASFITMDLMRLPLGILTGVGFIGGGAILKRGDMVIGVTTAATLWFVTVLGLCFGGGQILLGEVALCLGLLVLETLKRLEHRLFRDRRAQVIVVTDSSGPSQSQIADSLTAAQCRISGSTLSLVAPSQRARVSFTLDWHHHRKNYEAPSFVTELAQQPGVRRVEWLPR